MPDECVRAAAICYRKRKNPEFYLVTTKDRKKWVFPKGRLEGGEKPWEAAEREAKEEAGVTGKVETAMLTSYPFPGNEDCDELRVFAYLLKVKHVGRPSRKERRRDGAWWKPDKAREKLEGPQAEVIDAALKRLSQGKP